MRNAILIMLMSALSSAASAAWVYSEKRDGTWGQTEWRANTVSVNLVEFGYPINGAQRAELVVRKHLRFGTSVYIRLARSRFLCRSFYSCDVIVRFDHAPPIRFPASGPSDHATNILFIRDEPRFVSALKSAKFVRIEAEFYQSGSKILEFDVDGFQWGQSVPTAN
jgi:hypothetical protein